MGSPYLFQIVISYTTCALCEKTFLAFQRKCPFIEGYTIIPSHLPFLLDVCTFQVFIDDYHGLLDQYLVKTNIFYSVYALLGCKSLQPLNHMGISCFDLLPVFLFLVMKYVQCTGKLCTGNAYIALMKENSSEFFFKNYHIV